MCYTVSFATLLTPLVALSKPMWWRPEGALELTLQANNRVAPCAHIPCLLCIYGSVTHQSTHCGLIIPWTSSGTWAVKSSTGSQEGKISDFIYVGA